MFKHIHRSNLIKISISFQGTPVIGGLTCREAYYLAELISDTNKLKALDIVEINPLLGTKADVQRTLTISTNLILNFLGKQRN